MYDVRLPKKKKRKKKTGETFRGMKEIGGRRWWDGRKGREKKEKKRGRKKYSRVRRRVAQIIFHRVAAVPDRGSGIHAPMDMQRRQNIMQRSLLSSLRSSISPYPTKEGFVAKRSSAADKTLPVPLPLPCLPLPFPQPPSFTCLFVFAL